MACAPARRKPQQRCSTAKPACAIASKSSMAAPRRRRLGKRASTPPASAITTRNGWICSASAVGWPGAATARRRTDCAAAARSKPRRSPWRCGAISTCGGRWPGPTPKAARQSRPLARRAVSRKIWHSTARAFSTRSSPAPACCAPNSNRRWRNSSAWGGYAATVSAAFAPCCCLGTGNPPAGGGACRLSGLKTPAAGVCLTLSSFRRTSRKPRQHAAGHMTGMRSTRSNCCA